jgi:hypothetical protein
MWRVRDSVRSEACGNHTFCNPTPYARPNARVPTSAQHDIFPPHHSPPFVLFFIVGHSDPGLALPAVPDSADRTQDRQRAAEIQAEVEIHRAVAGTENSEGDHREVGMASLEAEEACLVLAGRVAWAFRGRLVVESCLVGDHLGEAYRALGAFRACRMVEVGRLKGILERSLWRGKGRGITNLLEMGMVALVGRQGFDRAWGLMRIGLRLHMRM